MRKHNYPKARKLPENSMKAELLKRKELHQIFKIWFSRGMYKAANFFDVSPGCIHYIAILNKWKREMPSHLVKAYKAGNWPSVKTHYLPQQSNQPN
jgi:hypothetical protein